MDRVARASFQSPSLAPTTVPAERHKVLAVEILAGDPWQIARSLIMKYPRFRILVREVFFSAILCVVATVSVVVVLTKSARGESTFMMDLDALNKSPSQATEAPPPAGGKLSGDKAPPSSEGDKQAPNLKSNLSLPPKSGPRRSDPSSEQTLEYIRTKMLQYAYLHQRNRADNNGGVFAPVLNLDKIDAERINRALDHFRKLNTAHLPKDLFDK